MRGATLGPGAGPSLDDAGGGFWVQAAADITMREKKRRFMVTKLSRTPKPVEAGAVPLSVSFFCVLCASFGFSASSVLLFGFSVSSVLLWQAFQFASVPSSSPLM